MRVWPLIEEALRTEGGAALVSLASVRGSAPREPGARMVVRPRGGFHGTIGGGTLEWEALAAARRALATGSGSARLVPRVLGPDLGQCCGGSVQLLVETFDATARPVVEALAAIEREGVLATRGEITARGVRRTAVAPDAVPALICLVGRSRLEERFEAHRRPVVLFGAGHVGRALMLALAPLPFDLTWVDEREDVFPAAMPGNVTTVRTAHPCTVLDSTPDEALVVVMTHSHPRDLELVRAALSARRFHHVGVIGSASKRARFTRALREAGVEPDELERLRCPIGIGRIRSKHPAAIATAVAAELLERDEAPAIRRAPLATSDAAVEMAAR